MKKMPGFDSKRFLSITQSEKDELMCGICLGIVNNPYLAKCCRKLYCFDCINEWLQCSNTCPRDRSPLRVQDLLQSEKYCKLMENFEIHCDYESYGCKQTVTLKNLSQHLQSCVYDPERKCNVCGLMMGDIKNHNCIQLLIGEKNKYKNENEILRTKINEYKQRIFDVSHRKLTIH
jgi:hypothetical protein